MATILVADDNQLNRDMLARRLQRRGYEAIVAVDGQEAVQVTRSSLPDLILMDIRMPVMDGYEATRQLKADPATKLIPIIALTADGMTDVRDQTLAAGCDDFASKPIDMEPLVAMMNALLPSPKATLSSSR